MPPNWDSWGKIRILREGFDVEAVSKGWSLDIEDSPLPNSPATPTSTTSHPITNGHTHPADSTPSPHPDGAVSIYSDTIRDPSLDALQTPSAEARGLRLEISSLDPQAFLATQAAVLEKLKADTSGLDNSSGRYARGRIASLTPGVEGEEEGKVNEHIGPVQFNMGGIQVDADDMLQRLRVSCYFLSSLLLSSFIEDLLILISNRIAKLMRPPNQPPLAALIAAAQAASRVGLRITRHSPLSLRV